MAFLNARSPTISVGFLATVGEAVDKALAHLQRLRIGRDLLCVQDLELPVLMLAGQQCPRVSSRSPDLTRTDCTLGVGDDPDAPFAAERRAASSPVQSI